MDWFCDINWFAIHAKRFREAVAASIVETLGVEIFLPMVKVECMGHEVIKVSARPLFPSYFFGRFIPATFLEAVESARGVLHVIKSGTCPIPVDEQVVQEMKSRSAAR